MERLSDNAIDIIDDLMTEKLHYYTEYLPLIDAANLLAEYEDTGLTPQEIEQMKARMPLHKWAGESPEKMSIFGVSVKKIIEWAEAEKQGRLVIYDEETVLAMAKANAKVEEDKLELLRIIKKLSNQQSTVSVNV
jgi:hypothetical protein